MQRWGIILFCGAVIVGAYFLFAGEKKGTSLAPPPAVAGWDEIDECTPFTSFDGSQTLDFEASRKVSLANELDDTKKSEHKIDGTWSFNEEKKRYTIFLGEAASDYTLIKPNNSTLCILASGDIGSVNMRESWFALIEDFANYEPEDRY